MVITDDTLLIDIARDNIRMIKEKGLNLKTDIKVDIVKQKFYSLLLNPDGSVFYKAEGSNMRTAEIEVHEYIKNYEKDCIGC